MGFFSWNTQDTNRSISNTYSTIKPFRVIMTDNRGNQFIEDEYEGYGKFGGKDYYSLLDEMNGGPGYRERGITRAFSGDINTIFPSLSEDGRYYDGRAPENCQFQGYFYCEDEDEDTDEQ